jgi:hypothetical protein
MLLYGAEHFFITTLHRPRRKTASIIKEACLLLRCLAMYVLLLRAFTSTGMCLPGRCLAMGYTSQYYVSLVVYNVNSV